MSDPLLARLTDVFRNSFNDDTVALSASTTADDIEDWDSIAHISLMYAIEDEFGVEFAGNELAEFRDVGELLAYLERHAES